MKPHTLAARVATFQIAVVFLTLAGVVAGTSAAVDSLLARKTDDTLRDVAARVASLVEQCTQPDGPAQDRIGKEIEELRPADIRVEVRDESGRLRAFAGKGQDLGWGDAGCRDRALVRVCGARVGWYRVLASVDRSADIRARNRLILSLGAVAALAAAVVSLLSRRIMRRALRPLSELATRVNVIEPGAGQRIGLQCALEELGLLEARFDDLVDRFEQALARERRLTAQASHELRTPLAVARAEIEALATSDDRGGPERALAAVDRLAELVETLLWFARAQSRLDDEAMQIVNIADTVRAQLAVHRLGGPHAAVVSRLPDEALVRGDEHLLGRTVANLIDNALKYGRGAPIEITADLLGKVVRIEVANGGGSVCEGIHERIFEPFFRGHSRRSEAPGFGLGLPFARAVARAHGGDVALESTSTNRTAFVLTLPVIAWSDR